MISFQNIHKSYSKNNQTIHALRAINLHIDKGDIFGVIGYSGAGKSTLIRLVNHLEAPSQGTVIVNDHNLATLSKEQLRQAKKRIGMIFQHFNLLESKTVAENIALPLKLNHRLTSAQIDARVDELLAYVEIPDKKHVYPKALSGGQKQRVGIARALANHPDILLCDEATSALDPQTTRSILDLLGKINREQGVTIMIVTHQMEVIEYLCNKVAVMEQGRVVEVDHTLNIFKNPQHATTQNFINTVLKTQIPARVLASIDTVYEHNIYRLEFLGGSAQEPVVNALILQGRVRVNILFANMIEIEGTVIGGMFVELQGVGEDIQAALDFLTAKGVRVTTHREVHHV